VVEGWLAMAAKAGAASAFPAVTASIGVTVLAPGVGQAMPGRSGVRGQRGSTRIVQLDKEQRSERETNGQKHVHPGGARHFHVFTV